VQRAGPVGRVDGVSEVLSEDHEVVTEENEPERSYDEFFRAVFPRLVGQAYLLTGSQAVAQDLAQEALARAWARWRRVGALDRPEAWVRRVLHNLAVDEARWHGRRRRLPLADVAAPAGPDVEAMTVAAALQVLPPSHRRAMVLHDVAGVPVDEIAEEIGVPSGTVRSWLSRDRALLAERLSAENEESSHE